MSLVASWPCVDRGRGGPYQRTDFFLLFSNKRVVLRRLLIKVRKKDVTAQWRDHPNRDLGCCSSRSGSERASYRSEFKLSSNWDNRNGSRWAGGRGWAGGCMRMQHHGTGWRATKGIRTKTLRTETLWLRDCLHGSGGPQVGEVTRLSIQSLILILSHLHDRWGDPPRVTSPIWGPPPPCKQTLK